MLHAYVVFIHEAKLKNLGPQLWFHKYDSGLFQSQTGQEEKTEEKNKSLGFIYKNRVFSFSQASCALGSNSRIQTFFHNVSIYLFFSDK